jgi:hypothetical protein
MSDVLGCGTVPHLQNRVLPEQWELQPVQHQIPRVPSLLIDSLLSLQIELLSEQRDVPELPRLDPRLQPVLQQDRVRDLQLWVLPERHRHVPVLYQPACPSTVHDLLE